MLCIHCVHVEPLHYLAKEQWQGRPLAPSHQEASLAGGGAAANENDHTKNAAGSDADDDVDDDNDDERP